MVEDVTKENALRLLQAMDEHQAKGRAGVTVVPNEVAVYAGLQSGEDDYEAALRYLIDRGALVQDERFENVVGGSAGNVAWIMTRVAFFMLEEE